MHDSSSDMIEYCLGVRNVYAARATGQMSQVDLFNSHGIVQGLNDAALIRGDLWRFRCGMNDRWRSGW